MLEKDFLMAACYGLTKNGRVDASTSRYIESIQILPITAGASSWKNRAY
jgi:hypothetical protein